MWAFHGGGGGFLGKRRSVCFFFLLFLDFLRVVGAPTIDKLVCPLF